MQSLELLSFYPDIQRPLSVTKKNSTTGRSGCKGKISVFETTVELVTEKKKFVNVFTRV